MHAAFTPCFAIAACICAVLALCIPSRRETLAAMGVLLLGLAVLLMGHGV